MALKQVAGKWGAHVRCFLCSLQNSRRWQSSPTVWDKLVEITVFDTNGKRHILRGKEGDTLVDLLAMNEDALGGTGVVGLSPDGRGVMEAIVTIPNAYLAQVPPPLADDMRSLAELSATGTNVSKNARLASKIKLTSALNDVHIALTPLQPWRTL